MGTPRAVFAVAVVAVLAASSTGCSSASRTTVATTGGPTVASSPRTSPRSTVAATTTAAPVGAEDATCLDALDAYAAPTAVIDDLVGAAEPGASVPVNAAALSLVLKATLDLQSACEEGAHVAFANPPSAVATELAQVGPVLTSTQALSVVILRADARRAATRFRAHGDWYLYAK